MMDAISITEGTIDMVVELSQQIPEFVNPHGAAVYQARLSKAPHLILVAFIAQKAVGFKVGYEREGYFYSWMGGVLPAYRKLGIAQKLADAQENWARSKGYPSVTFKTRNHHKAMLLFAIKNGFDIIGVETRDVPAEHRILLQKKL